MRQNLLYRPVSEKSPFFEVFTYVEVGDNLGPLLGRIYQEMDGFYYFVPRAKIDGIWPDYVLLEIGQKLYDLNKEARESLK